ncbi:cell division protein FtsQ/DivIB [Roseomonas marmotae]|uniref:Cell division protein FtsQ n=2 Tax=Roseomonas marmotae TaxID=2768161 RepID=A0ABS3KBJ0_9PROT|nr:cell division protein FtsQ/DivIB [Roseomonas marmotae]QTI80887.1 cell division protein FtsQ/DivIB [Roseomonas marmotae]
MRAPPRSRLASEGARPRPPVPQRPSSLRLWLRRRRPLLRPALIGLGTLAAAGACGVAFAALEPAGRFSWLNEGVAEIGAQAGLVVQKIVVRGQQNTPKELISAAIGVRNGDPLLAFSPEAARQRLESIAWIERAEVQRNLSGDITVELHERRPFAIWQRNNDFAVVDRDGRVVSADTLDAFGPLPLLVGEGAHKHGAAVFDELKQAPDVRARVQALIYVSQRRWNLRLHNGTDILLPEGHEAAAITRLAELQKSQALLDRPVVSIDMRLPDRLVVRQHPRPEQPASNQSRGRGRG